VTLSSGGRHYWWVLGAVTIAPAAPTTAAAPDAHSDMSPSTGSDINFVESPIKTNETWPPESGPYRIIRFVAVEPRATLTAPRIVLVRLTV